MRRHNISRQSAGGVRRAGFHGAFGMLDSMADRQVAGIIQPVRARAASRALLGVSGLSTLIWLVLVLFCGASAAQSVARLDGTVTDASGAVVPDCHVVLINAESGVKYTTTTNDSGFYVFPFAPTGRYQLEFSKPSFKTAAISDVVLHANDRRAVNGRLEVQTIVERVEVTASPSGIPITDSGQKMETLTAQQIQDFSTVGRSAEELLPLLPGVVQNGSSAYYSSFSGEVVTSAHGIEGFNINGNRSDMNSYKLDGASLVDLTANNGSDIYPNMDFISELTVSTSNYTADQAGSPILISADTKAGGKDFHGELFWTGRNGAFDANDWTNNQAGIARPASQFNYPGFNLGGPVLLPWTKFNRRGEHKLFFFVGAEWSRQKPDLGTLLSVVPSAAELTGDFSDVVFSQDCLNNPTGMHLLQPCAITDPDTGQDLRAQNGKLSNPTANGMGLVKQLTGPNFQGPNGFYVDSLGRQWNFAGRQFKPQNVTQYVGRFDYSVSEKTRLFLRLGRQDETMFSDFGEYDVPGSTYSWGSNIPEPTTTIQKYNSRTLALNLTHTFSTTLANEFTFHAAVLRQPNYYQDAAKLSKTTLGVNFKGVNIMGSYPAANYPIVPQINVGFDCTQINSSGCGSNSIAPYAGRYGSSNLVGRGNFYKNTLFEFGDNLSKGWRNHTLKFGAYVQRARNDQNASLQFLEGLLQIPGWAGSSSGDEFSDILTERFKGYQQGSAAPEGFFRETMMEWYAQDSWKATPRLTLEYGIRWSWLLPWTDAHGQAVTFDPSAYDPSQPTNVYNGLRTASCSNPGQSAVPLCGTIPYGIMPNGHPATQPRLGFAWDTMGNGRLVLRGGFGEYTSRDQGNATQSVISGPPNLVSVVDYTTSNPNWNQKGYFTLSNLENAPATNPTSFSLSPFGVYSQRDAHIPSVYQYNVTISSTLPHKLFAEIAYVGSQSRHLLITKDINAVPLRVLWSCSLNSTCNSTTADHTLIGTPFTNADSFRPFLPYNTLYALFHSANANYNGLQTTLRRQAGHSLDFIASYTYSKALGESDYYGTPLLDPFTDKNNHRILDFDRTHVFSLGYQYRVPALARGALENLKAARGALNGWMLTGIARATSGGPFAINANVTCQLLDSGGNPTDVNSNPCYLLTNPKGKSVWAAPWINPGVDWFGSSVYASGYLPGNIFVSSGVLPAYTCDPVNSRHKGLGGYWINTNCVTLPPFAQQGAFNPPYMKTPGYSSLDIGLQKTFQFAEKRHLDFRVSAFNLSNHPYLGSPDPNASFLWQLPANAIDPSQGKAVPDLGQVANDGGVGNRNFGKIAGKSGHRELEASVRLFF